MRKLRMIAAAVALFSVAGCTYGLNVKYVDKEISKYKTGPKVALAAESIVDDVLAIEVMKTNRFQIVQDAAQADYLFNVNTLVWVNPEANVMPITYSFSVVTKTGEIVYIKALDGGDMKHEFQATLTELSGLLL